MMLPKSQMRGAQYKDNRLHFLTSITPDALEEIEGIVRFGGVDFDDEKRVLARQDVSLILLELDMNELDEFDEQMEWVRSWHRDEGVTHNIGVWTSKPVPMDALSVIKTL